MVLGSGTGCCGAGDFILAAAVCVHGWSDLPASVARKGSASACASSWCTVKSISLATTSFGNCSLTLMHKRTWLPLWTLSTCAVVRTTLVTPSMPTLICSSIRFTESGPIQFLRRSSDLRYGNVKTSCKRRLVASSSRPLSTKLITNTLSVASYLCNRLIISLISRGPKLRLSRWRSVISSPSTRFMTYLRRALVLKDSNICVRLKSDTFLCRRAETRAFDLDKSLRYWSERC
mmetsp:Transcript_46136/g.128333  ORF Transcript_46136/g.128333 Transcript_46136/m.128333 type:complete len:233 (-) Transcript_46136:1743-2441(-)